MWGELCTASGSTELVQVQVQSQELLGLLAGHLKAGSCPGCAVQVGIVSVLLCLSARTYERRALDSIPVFYWRIMKGQNWEFMRVTWTQLGVVGKKMLKPAIYSQIH